MSLVTMQALLADAEKGGYALGGFVTTDLMVTQSLIQASDCLLYTSPSPRDTR